MITKKDIEAIKTAFEPRFKALEDKLENKIVEFKDEILGQISALREEVTMVTGYRQDINDLDERVTKLEKHTGLH